MTSDRGDGNQVHRYELRSGEIRQLTSASALAPRAVNLTPDDRAFLFLDGPSLRISTLSGLREREIYRIPDGWQLGEGFCLSGDGIYAVLIETSGTRHRLRLIGVARGDAVTVVEAEVPLRHPRPRPRRAGILYERDGHLQVVSYDGKSDRKLFPVVNSPGAAHWSPDGRSVLYLQAQGRAVSLRECTPDTMQDRHVAPTTQFGSFGQNSDASVFLGASSSVASPFVLLLLRAARRELTLCEHKASDPLMVAPVFSPTSQRVYFQSDRHGKPAIYSVVVDKFIEKTESDEELKPPEVKKTGLEDV